MAKKKECPSCAMEIGSDEKVCPVCGYEFPTLNKGYALIAVLLVILLLLMIMW